MASRIAGITVEINGDTTKLTKALDGTNKKIRNTQTELRDVEKLLKLDPKNITLLKQKQELLTKAVEETNDKLKTLKDAQKNMDDNGVDKNSEQYRGLQREIIDVEQSLDKLERASKDADGSLGKLDKAIDETGESADRNGDKLSKFGDVAGKVAKAAGAALTATGTAAIKLGKEVVTGYGELEQNLGGSEAVFGNSAAKLQKISEDAYKTMGTSQSEYLANANKMGALFQGSGIKEQRSLELTTKAMQRATDVASVMGIDTEAALEAITGAAKGNYTMMDNLGIKMDATTLKAYAVSEGFEKSFDKMSNAQKAELAMQYFFENTEKYAGNFEREATQTINGSLGMLSASFQSFIAGLGNSDADIENLSGNVIDAFDAVVANIEPVIQNIINALPVVVDALMGAVEKMAPKFTQILGELIPILGDMLIKIGFSILSMLPELISMAVNLLETLILEIVNFLSNGGVEILISSAVSLFMAIVDAIPQILPPLINALPSIITTIIYGLLNATPQLIDGALQLLLAIVDAIPLLIEAIVPIIPDIVIAIGAALINAKVQLLQAALQLFGSLTVALFNVGATLVKQVVEIVTSMKKKFSNGLEKIKGFFKDLKLEFPKIKLPHFKLTGELSLNPPSVPKLSIDWYAKAMNTPMLLKAPTIFGMAGGKLLGGGEAGQEVVSGAATLMRMIERAMATTLATAMPGNMSSTIRHTGTIRIEGVNNQGEFIAAENIAIEDILVNALRRQARL